MLLVTFNMKKQLDPIHKATIIPRGRALGMVLQLARKGQARIISNKRAIKCSNGYSYMFWRKSCRRDLFLETTIYQQVLAAEQVQI